jgi:hypothetical protein
VSAAIRPREGRPATAIAIAVLTLGLFASGCHRETPVATMLELAGMAERGVGDAWAGAVPGTAFFVGDALRTGAAARARLTLTGGGVIRVGENARIRFQRGAIVGQKSPDLAVELGSAEVDETASDFSIVTAIGPARVLRGTSLRVRADGGTASLEVLVGRAVMMEAGREVAIEPGRGVRIRLGSAEIEQFALTVGPALVEEETEKTAAPAPAAPAAVPDAAAARADDAREEPRRAARADAAHPDTSRADLTVRAGESATVHDGRAEAAVRLRFQGLCPGDAIVELSGQGHRRERFAGAAAVVLRLKPGTRSYRVRCDGQDSRAEPRASGVLSFRRDTGDVPLPRRAPVDVIDADGRRYTVLFQTRLPQLTLAWPGAPAGANRLQLHVESSSGERVIESANPRRPLAAGTIAEGTYTFWYRADSGAQSPKTTVSIRFDNAAPTAQFFRTGPSDKGARGAIAVEGVTVAGAKVSVGGQPLEVDGRGRFRTEARPLDGDEAVAVRLEHPRTGVHYYVRRPAGAR